MTGFFRKSEKKDIIDPAAYSRDGYLINQGLLKDISYGRRTTRETGCGWIACYNFLRSMGRPEPAVKVARRMEKMLLWGGYIGSHPLAVWWYLHRRGFRFHFAFTRRKMERVLSRCGEKKAGVIAYWHGKGSHFAAFTEGTPSREEIRLRFLNATYGAENQQLTVKEFFSLQVRFPLVLVIVARSPADAQDRSGPKNTDQEADSK